MKKLISLVAAFAIVCSFVLCVSAAPVEKPSVVRSEAPEVSTISVVNSEGEVVNSLPTSTIVITPVSAVDDEETDPETAEELEEAYDELCEVESISELEGGEELEEEIDEEYGEGTTDDLVVREVFGLEFSEEYDEYLQDGNTVVVTFDTNISQDETLVVMVKVDGEWQVIPKEDIKVNADGSVEITFHEPLSGPVAFLVDETPLSDVTPEPDEDEGSGEHVCTCILCKLFPSLCGAICGNCDSWPICPCWFILLGAILLIVVLVFVFKEVRKSRKEKRKAKIREERAKKREAKKNK